MRRSLSLLLFFDCLLLAQQNNKELQSLSREVRDQEKAFNQAKDEIKHLLQEKSALEERVSLASVLGF